MDDCNRFGLVPAYEDASSTASSGTAETPEPVSSLFTVDDTSTLMNDRLMRVASRMMPGANFDANYLLMKLRAEEQLAEIKFQTFFTPRQMYPQGMSLDQVAIWNTENYPAIEEPGYDYDPNFLSGDEWGFLQLRRTHIITVQDITFDYPSTENSLFKVPINWVRMDKKFGRINVVPTTTPVELPLNIFIMGALAGGRKIPLMLQIAYQCGLKNARQDFPLLIDYIMKSAVVSILQDEFFPQSGSVSADGLSQSMSMDISKYQDQLEGREKSLRDFLTGPVLAFA